MSMHPSLKVKNKHVRRRNVLNREEQIEKLTEDERWEEGTSVFGLPKVRVVVQAPRKHKEKEAEAEGEGTAEAAEGAATQ